MFGDDAIISSLRTDARRSLVSMSYSEKIPVSTIFDRLARLDSVVIKKYVSLLDPSYLRFGIHCFIVVLDPSMCFFVKDCVNLNSVCGLEHKDKFIVELFFRSISELVDYKKLLAKNKVKLLKEFVVYEELFREQLLTESKAL